MNAAKPRFLCIVQRLFGIALGLLAMTCYRRYYVALAIAGFCFAGCAARPINVMQIPQCTGSETGYKVIYYFDRNDVLISAEKRDEHNSNLFPPLNSKNASKLIADNSEIPFPDDPKYPFRKHVSNLNTGSAVFAVVSNDQCPTYQCVFKTKATDWLRRDVTDNGYKKNCRDMTCPNGVIPCGKYWCCR